MRQSRLGRAVAGLARRTSSGGFIPEIDGLRFIPIAWVVIYHVNQVLRAEYGGPSKEDPFVQFVKVGAFAPHLFFVISGFVLALPFAAHHLTGRKKVRLGEYYLRRVTRLWPAYVVIMSCLFLWRLLAEPSASRSLAPHYLIGLLFQHDVTYGTANPLNGVAWSLEVEIQFYALLPLLAMVFAVKDVRLRRGIIVGVVAASIVLQRNMSMYAYACGPRPCQSVVNFIQFFLVGFLLADVYLADWKGRPARHWRWDVVWLASVFALVYILRPVEPQSSLLRHWAFPPLVLVFFISALRGAATSRVLRAPVVFTVGGMCYTIYLLHFVIITFLIRNLTGTLAGSASSNFDVVVQSILLVPVVLVVSSFFFAAVERPTMNKQWPQLLTASVRQLALGRRTRTVALPSGTESELWPAAPTDPRQAMPTTTHGSPMPMSTALNRPAMPTPHGPPIPTALHGPVLDGKGDTSPSGSLSDARLAIESNRSSSACSRRPTGS